MNYSLNQTIHDSIINLTFTIGEWSECIDNQQTREITIRDQYNNIYNFDKQLYNKQGILMTTQSMKCQKEFTWKSENIAFLVCMLMFITCVFTVWCVKSGSCNTKKAKDNSHMNKSMHCQLENRTTRKIPKSSRHNDEVGIRINNLSLGIAGSNSNQSSSIDIL